MRPSCAGFVRWKKSRLCRNTLGRSSEVLHGVGSPIKIVALAIIASIAVLWICAAQVVEITKRVREKHEGLMRAEKKFPRVFRFLYSGKARFFLLVAVLVLFSIDWRDATTISPPILRGETSPPPVFIVQRPSAVPHAQLAGKSVQSTQSIPAQIIPNYSLNTQPPAKPPIVDRVAAAYEELDLENGRYTQQITKFATQVDDTVRQAESMPRAYIGLDPKDQPEAKKKWEQGMDALRETVKVEVRQEYLDESSDANKWFDSHHEVLMSLHQESIEHMKIHHPDEWVRDAIDNDASIFDKALNKAAKKPLMVDLEDGKVPKDRFQPLDDYFGKLSKKLKGYPDS